MLENIRIVLVETSHSGNIGASARAMKTMGLHNLYLVAPKQEIDAQALAMAAGAEDVLNNAKIVSSFVDAVDDCQLVIGTSARLRHLQNTVIDPHHCAEKVVTQAARGNAAIVFGRERIGLTNEELLKCQYHLNIPANPDYTSLNLAMAVQIVGYEIHQSWLQAQNNPLIAIENSYPNYAEAKDLHYFLEQTENCYRQLGFIKNQSVMPKLWRLYNRARLEKNELNILIGMLQSVNNLLSSNTSKVD